MKEKKMEQVWSLEELRKQIAQKEAELRKERERLNILEELCYENGRKSDPALRRQHRRIDELACQLMEWSEQLPEDERRRKAEQRSDIWNQVFSEEDFRLEKSAPRKAEKQE